MAPCAQGVLMYGPPGTGKTLLARAVAHHTDCTFIRVSGSELVQKYIGEGSRMVRELFVMAREHAPSIIFMDEIDSIGGARQDGESGGDSEVQRTMLELLNQLDGFEASNQIKVRLSETRPEKVSSDKPSTVACAHTLAAFLEFLHSRGHKHALPKATPHAQLMRRPFGCPSGGDGN